METIGKWIVSVPGVGEQVDGTFATALDAAERLVRAHGGEARITGPKAEDVRFRLLHGEVPAWEPYIG